MTADCFDCEQKPEKDGRHNTTDLAYRVEINLIRDTVSAEYSLSATLPLAFDRDGSLGEPLHVLGIVLAQEIVERRRQEETEQRRVCDEELRFRRSGQLWHLGIGFFGRIDHPSPQRPEPVHHRVLGKGRAGFCGFET